MPDSGGAKPISHTPARSVRATVLLLMALLAVMALVSTYSYSSARADTSPVEAAKARGMLYNGLQYDETLCRNGLLLVGTTSRGRPLCTHGPDPAPPNVDVRVKAAPLKKSARMKSNTAQCDGDGESGLRVQVIYAHGSDIQDAFATYADSFQQWINGVDDIINASAQETGGTRHVRFVTDADCNPVVADVTLTARSDDNFYYMIWDLDALGYNRTDRKYLVFMDGYSYCGISTIQDDDRADPTNVNNSGPSYSRIDPGCWSSVIPAHELTHLLGGVQLSAPHSDGNYHCMDSFDDMCDHAGHGTNAVCPDPIGDQRLDCNHDDYFNTNPAPDSYLATHWNVANSSFLIQPDVPVVSIETGSLKNGQLTPRKTFHRGASVGFRITVANQSGAGKGNEKIEASVRRPNGGVRCHFSGVTDSNGTAQGSCKLAPNARLGLWHITIESVGPGFSANSAPISAPDTTFQVK